MKKLLLLLIYSTFIIHHSTFAQLGEWTWMNGDSTTIATAVFGTQGIPAPANKPPGLYEACEWTDLNGNFWLYGGKDNGGTNNWGDLWKYDPAINQWTWVKGPGIVSPAATYGTMGVSAPANTPGARGWGSATWVDSNNNLWMFGGLTNLTTNNDLWMYNISTNEWTWMKGDNITGQPGVWGTQGVPDPANKPSARAETNASWVDSLGNLWLYGGYSLNTGDCWEDLWMYNIATNEWTWMKGSNIGNQLPVFGTKGVSAPTNSPGGRLVYSKWKDKQNKFWLFGGGTSSNYYNDLWKYDPLINEWVWVSGTNIMDDLGNYGGYCVAGVNFVPRNSVENRACWTDACGKFWHFGGTSDLSFGTSRSDLWNYDPATNEWKLISGTNSTSPNANHGTLGVSSPANIPGGKSGALPFTDLSGNLWLFGGTSAFWPSTYNDMWRYVIDTNCVSGNCVQSLPVADFTIPDTTLCEPECIASIQNLSSGATSYEWQFPGGTPATSNVANPSFICYAAPGTYSITLIATNAAGTDTITYNNYITVYPAPAIPTFTQNGDTLFASLGYTSYQWYDSSIVIPGATNYYYIATHNGNYNIIVTDENGCSVGAGILNVVTGIERGNLEERIRVFPNPAKDKISISIFNSQYSTFNIEVYNSIGEKIYTVTLSGVEAQHLHTINTSDFGTGIYLLKISSEEKIFAKKIIIEK